METQITSDNIQVTDSMKELAKDKLSRIELRLKHIKDDDSKFFRVVMNTAPNETFEVKIDASIQGKKFYVGEVNFSIESAMISAVEELSRQMEKSRFFEQDWEERRDAKFFPTDAEDVE